MYPSGMDVDEPIYLDRALFYQDAIGRLDLLSIITDPVNIEHPLWGKFLFTFGIWMFGEDSLFGFSDLFAARLISVLLGAGVSVLLLLYVNRVSAYVWILSSWAMKYTAEVYLEAAVTFFSVFALITYAMSIQDARTLQVRLFLLSGVLASLAFTSKYTGILAGVVIFIHFSFQQNSSNTDVSMQSSKVLAIVQGIRMQLAWMSTFLITAVLSNPRMLLPLNFLESLRFHYLYSTQDNVQNTDPFGQFSWLFGGSNPTAWHGKFLLTYFDHVFFLLGLVGVVTYFSHRAYQEINASQRAVLDVLGYYFIVYSIFLITWQTKWPQYLVGFMVPVSVFSGYVLIFWARLIVRRVQDLQTQKMTLNLSGADGRRLFLTFLLIVALLSALALTSYEPPSDPDPDDQQSTTTTDTTITTTTPPRDGGFSLANVNWTIATNSLADNTHTIKDSILVWRDASDDDTGDGDYTYPTNEGFTGINPADITQVQLRNAQHYLLVSIELADLVSLGWGSPSGQDPTTIFFGLQFSSNPQITSISGAEFSFPAVDLLVAVVWEVFVIDSTGSQTIDASYYQINGDVFQLVLPKADYGITSDRFGVFAASGLQDGFAEGGLRELEPTQSEWQGGGGSTNPDEADLYDLALISSDQATTISSRVLSALFTVEFS